VITTEHIDVPDDRLIVGGMKAAPSDGYQGVYQVAQARAAQERGGT
jgi:hypothetical protein